jgi:hypothetical protein
LEHLAAFYAAMLARKCAAWCQKMTSEHHELMMLAPIRVLFMQ